jgi:hypothetical protein
MERQAEPAGSSPPHIGKAKLFSETRDRFAFWTWIKRYGRKRGECLSLESEILDETVRAEVLKFSVSPFVSKIAARDQKPFGFSPGGISPDHRVRIERVGHVFDSESCKSRPP